jgi:phage shock protein A
MNLFSRLSEILSFGPNEPWQKGNDLERIFAWNSYQMDQDVMSVKRYACTVIAMERRLARELKWQRANNEQDEVLRRLETECRAAREDRERVLNMLRSLEAALAEVCRKQRSIVARQRAAIARPDLHRKALAGTPDGCGVKARLERLLDELTQFEREWMVQVGGE